MDADGCHRPECWHAVWPTDAAYPGRRARAIGEAGATTGAWQLIWRREGGRDGALGSEMELHVGDYWRSPGPHDG